MKPGLYWVILNEDGDWEPAELSDSSDTWFFMGNDFTCNTAAIHMLGPAITSHEASLAIAQARFLCDRLDDFEFSTNPQDSERDFYGHVDPALARLKNTLDVGDQAKPVPVEKLTDARQLAYLSQAMVNTVIPMAEYEPVDGNFTIKLNVKRRKGKALVDVQLSVGGR